MLFFEEKGRKILSVTLDEQTTQSIKEELENYRLVYTRFVRWERLDEDREGENKYEEVYPLGQENCPVNHYIIVKNNEFIGVGISYSETTSWDAGLNKTVARVRCTLYKDGRVKGSASSVSTYDSPNNYDEVTKTYSLRKVV